MPELIKISSPEIDTTPAQIDQAIAMKDEFVRRNLEALGARVGYILKRVIAPHRFTGGLEDSVTFDVSGTRLEVGPTKKTGSGHDRGLILEMGTGPIPYLPFEPIRQWAEFRGLPAGPVWAKIRREGVTEHPWVDDVVAQGDFRTALENTAGRIGLDLVGFALLKMGGSVNYGSQVITEI